MFGSLDMNNEVPSERQLVCGNYETDNPHGRWILDNWASANLGWTVGHWTAI